MTRTKRKMKKVRKTKRIDLCPSARRPTDTRQQDLFCWFNRGPATTDIKDAQRRDRFDLDAVHGPAIIEQP